MNSILLSTIKQLGIYFLLISLFACESETPGSDYMPPDGSFGLVYSKIFTPSCALSGCHNGEAREPSLTGEDTYNNIFGKTPVNQNAANAMLEYIMASSPDSSFLYQKIAYDSSQFQFGSAMPLGGISLTADQVTFVRQWIVAGAPESGHVADRSLVE
ncbi:MAG: hypothetical protein AAFR87_12370 [Bacteroidota bacterium]